VVFVINKEELVQDFCPIRTLVFFP